MNTSLTAYTHLESLLLFQCLNTHGVNPPVFSKISELLKNNPHIAADKGFQSGRLSPDALRNFYLHILKEEIRSERQDGTSDTSPPNGEVRNSRKRKAPSPNLPTSQEAAQHAHLIPNLITKLYTRYRAAITEQIRDEENRIARLHKDCQSIERGEWDQQLQERANAKISASRSPSLPRRSPLLPQRSFPPSPSPHHAKQDVLGVRDASVPNGPRPVEQVPAERDGRDNWETHPLAHPNLQIPPDHVATLAPSVQHAAPQSMQLPSSPHVPYVSHAQSSAVAPPASSMQFQSQPAQSYGGSGIPTYGSLSGAQPQMSPTHQRFPSQYQPGSQSPGVHTPLQQRNHHRYLGQQPFHTPQMGQSLPSGGVMLPPFQVSPQHPASSQPSSSVPNYPQMSTPVNVRQLPPSAASGRSGVPQMHNLVTQARQSFSTPGNTRTPNSAMFTPRSTRSVRSRLKSDVVNSPVVDRPNVQPIDDDSGPEATMSKQVQSKAKLPRKSRAKPKANENEAERGQHVIDEPEKEVEKDKTSGKGKERGKGKAKEKEKEKEPAPPPAPEESEEPVLEIETRQGRSRRKAPAIRRRLGSKASSQAGGSVRERSRSPSILSHTDTVTADNESQVGYQVKSEPGLANDVIDEDSATTRSQPSTRRRAAAPTLKRKRNAREASLAESEEQQPPTPELRTVVAARQFQKMSKPVLDDISSHQFSSLFTTAVKAKDAEGYYDIIKRPTDLNSIKKAIGAGTKVVQAVATDTPVGSPGGGGSVVEVPMTLEYIPPKAIVNPAQLEKELMRMFVNAVMFNAGEEGIVVDARSMFETVQQSVSSWRSIKHSSAKVVVEETPPVEEDAPIASKRRKL
ncbi:hypothetical protein K504DRAFT_477824 [Pleomassaria siparia CBS 279.74]|uniref:Bromo domain-containing protein n=1 Tax=Pleomassaria siparia CBS 279.74 TaxID=1314801 RepID=A0A6G1K6P0_9PLEO|nr:hypothetical protein K504DRAFT_477824 [Pleomassaria siparia CBS 279.74]